MRASPSLDPEGAPQLTWREREQCCFPGWVSLLPALLSDFSWSSSLVFKLHLCARIIEVTRESCEERREQKGRLTLNTRHKPRMCSDTSQYDAKTIEKAIVFSHMTSGRNTNVSSISPGRTFSPSGICWFFLRDHFCGREDNARQMSEVASKPRLKETACASGF